MSRPRPTDSSPFEFVAPSDVDRARRRDSMTPFARLAALGVVFVGWVVPSVVVWFVAMVSIGGVTTRNGDAAGLLDDIGDVSAWLATVASAVVMAAVTGLLVGLSQWALPGRRGSATLIGVVAALWAPDVCTVYVVAR
jgi:hypothetical protein